jgi:arylsulfatase A-like enzyme
VRGDREWIDSVRYSEVAVDEAGWQHLRELYAARMGLADRTLGRLLDALTAAGRAEDTVVVVTADHGEALGEHGHVEHGDSVYGELVEVPLLIVVPGREPAASSGPASLVDVAPTLLALAGLPMPGDMDGLDLLGAPPDPRRALVARNSDRLPRLSWTSGGMRPIVDLSTRHRELYDLVRDPRELVDLYEQRPATAALLFRELCAAVCAAEGRRRDEAAAEDAASLPAGDPALTEQVRQIGYVSPSGEAVPANDASANHCDCLRALLRRT